MIEKFKYFNPNPEAKTFKSGKVKIWGKDDSAVRALCAALNLSWDDAYSKLCEMGAKIHDIPTSKATINEYCIINGFEHVTYGKPGKGEIRPTLEDFVTKMTKGTYIVYLSHYFVCVKDGELLDTINEGASSIYSYWKLID